MPVNETHIHTGDGLRYANGDWQLYLELLRLFEAHKEQRQRKLEATWKSIMEWQGNDERLDTLWGSVIIQVHDLKGEARGIGAAALGGLFYGLELALRERNPEKAEMLFPAVETEWRQVVEEIRRLGQNR